jgi:hypothetical protein
MRNATSSGIVNNGRRTKRKRKIKFRNKQTVIVTMREAVLLQLRRSCTINLADGDDMTWISDKGAIIHATSHRALFKNYSIDDFGVVNMGNNDI